MAPPPAETDTAYVGWSSREATAPRHGTLCVQVVCPDHQLAAPSLHHSIIPRAFQHQPVKQNTLRTAVLMTNSNTNSINANDSSYTYTKKLQILKYLQGSQTWYMMTANIREQRKIFKKIK